MSSPDVKWEYRLEGLMRDSLRLLGEDVEREGLRETPARWARMMQELLERKPFKLTTFDAEGADEMIVQAGIPFFSLCEHHVIPFFGTAVVAYLPDQRIVGLSKLARLVDYHAGGLQNQERITSAVAKELQAKLKPRGVAVSLRARHLCMEMRGVKKHDTWTTTTSLLGCFRSDPAVRSEFLSYVVQQR